MTDARRAWVAEQLPRLRTYSRAPDVLVHAAERYASGDESMVRGYAGTTRLGSINRQIAFDLPLIVDPSLDLVRVADEVYALRDQPSAFANPLRKSLAKLAAHKPREPYVVCVGGLPSYNAGRQIENVVRISRIALPWRPRSARTMALSDNDLIIRGVDVAEGFCFGVCHLDAMDAWFQSGYVALLGERLQANQDVYLSFYRSRPEKPWALSQSYGTRPVEHLLLVLTDEADIRQSGEHRALRERQ